MKSFINKYRGWLSSEAQLWSVGLVDFFRPLYAKWYLGLAGVLNLTSLILATIIKWYLGDKQVIMHSNIVFGIDQIAGPLAVFWLPIFGLAVIIVNVILAYALTPRQGTILRHILLAGAVAVNIFVLMAVGSVYRINYINR